MARRGHNDDKRCKKKLSHINNVQPPCHNIHVTSTKSHQPSHNNHVTSTKSHQPSHNNQVTSTKSTAHPKETFAAAPWSREIRGGLQVLKSIFWKYMTITKNYMTITQIYIIITKTLIRIRTPNLHCFKAGDARVNEQPGLATLHTLWLRSDHYRHYCHYLCQPTPPSCWSPGNTTEWLYRWDRSTPNGPTIGFFLRPGDLSEQ